MRSIAARLDALASMRVRCGGRLGCALALAVALMGGRATLAMAAGDANQVSCPQLTEVSSGFRAFMPDCRAYEMVTPPYTAGDKVTGQQFAISPDGNHVLGVSIGGFAGVGNVEESATLATPAVYEFSRTSSGWTTEPLQPLASQFSHTQYLGTSQDLSKTLWDLVNQAGPEEEARGETLPYTLAIRESTPDGGARYTAVGPDAPPGVSHPKFEMAGSSRNLSTIVFGREVREGRTWPGDYTRANKQSLYEYRGTGNSEPVLVAVKNNGPLDGSPHINEGAELISECGARIGSFGSNGSTYNAVSADGSIVYFTSVIERCTTPKVEEVYARVDASRTVAISEPSLTIPGRECTGVCATDETVEADRKPGAFQGASEDGSKVFFTTEQPLLNSDGDSTNDLYEAEMGETGITKLVQVSHGDATDPTPGAGAEVVGVSRISEDGSHVYFVARGVLTTAPNAIGEVAEQGGFNMYVYDTVSGGTSFVATLATEAEYLAGGESLASEAELVDAGFADDRPVNATPDGRFLVFPSRRDLTGSEDTSTVSQLFEYDAQTGSLVRVSIGQRSPAFPAGYNDDGNTANGEDVPIIVIPRFNAPLKMSTEGESESSVTADGTVVFSSRAALTPQAVDGSQNVYEYRDGNVYLISPGASLAAEFAAFGVGETEDEEPRLLGVNASGTDVFMKALGSLVTQVSDSQYGWYDARVDGGFSEPQSPAACAGDACQGALSAPFTAPAPASVTTAAGGNLAAAPPTANVSKPKGKIKPKGKGKGKPKHKHKVKVKGKKQQRRSVAARDGRSKVTSSRGKK